MASALTIPGLDGHDGRARRAAAPVRTPAAQPELLQRLLGERETRTAGGGVTLDDVLVGAWEGLTAGRTVSCPACSVAMAPRFGAGPEPVGGRCGGCGTTIS